MAVNPNNKNLSELTELLQKIYPNDTVMAFNDHIAAIGYGFNNPASIIFAEAEMHRADGFTLIGALKTQSPNIMTVITADDDSYKEKARQLNVTAYLQRPITDEMLYKTIQSMKAKARDHPNCTGEHSTVHKSDEKANEEGGIT